MCYFVGVQYYFVDGGVDMFLVILLIYLGFQQKVFFGDVVVFQYVGELLQGVVWVKVGEKVEVVVVNVDDVNVVMGQGLCCVEYIVVVVYYYCEIGLLVNFCQCVGFYVVELKFMGDLLFNQYFIFFVVQLVLEYFMCGQGGGVMRMFYNVDIFEMVFYDLDVFVLNEIVIICLFFLKFGN